MIDFGVMTLIQIRLHITKNQVKSNIFSCCAADHCFRRQTLTPPIHPIDIPVTAFDCSTISQFSQAHCRLQLATSCHATPFTSTSKALLPHTTTSTSIIFLRSTNISKCSTHPTLHRASHYSSISISETRLPTTN